MAKVTFEVDKEGDIAYFTLGTGEPSYCEEFSDFILIERGIFSKLLTGIRILNFNKLRSGEIKFDRRDIQTAIIKEKSILQHFPQQKDRKELLNELLKKVDRNFVTTK
jgi:hypothetical protein